MFAETSNILLKPRYLLLAYFHRFDQYLEAVEKRNRSSRPAANC